MNKKTLWIILGITSNAIFLMGLLLIILSFKYDTQKEYAYTETTSINIQKDDKIIANERPLDDSQEHDNRVNKDNKDYATNNTSDYVIKTTTKNLHTIIAKTIVMIIKTIVTLILIIVIIRMIAIIVILIILIIVILIIVILIIVITIITIQLNIQIPVIVDFAVNN